MDYEINSVSVLVEIPFKHMEEFSDWPQTFSFKFYSSIRRWDNEEQNDKSKCSCYAAQGY